MRKKTVDETFENGELVYRTTTWEDDSTVDEFDDRAVGQADPDWWEHDDREIGEPVVDLTDRIERVDSSGQQYVFGGFYPKPA